MRSQKSEREYGRFISDLSEEKENLITTDLREQQIFAKKTRSNNNRSERTIKIHKKLFSVQRKERIHLRNKKMFTTIDLPQKRVSENKSVQVWWEKNINDLFKKICHSSDEELIHKHKQKIIRTWRITNPNNEKEAMSLLKREDHP